MEEIQQERKKMIAEALERQGMTQTDLAATLGRSWTTVQAWVNQRAIPEMTPEETLEMCKVFGCSLEDLVDMFPGRSKRRAALRQYAKENPNSNKKSAQE